MIVTIFVAEVKRDRSSGSLKFNFINSEPFNNCINKPAVTIGPIPNSSSVPCCAANITLANAKKSNCGAIVTPIERNLTHDKISKKCDSTPNEFLT